MFMASINYKHKVFRYVYRWFLISQHSEVPDYSEQTSKLPVTGFWSEHTSEILETGFYPEHRSELLAAS